MTILGGLHRLQFGKSAIDYELKYSRRKTLGIHVYPDSTVIVDAPIGTSLPEVEQKVYKRAGWIIRQQCQFQDSPTAQLLPRRYVSGETYRYLGRQYRLKLVASMVERVVLSRGYLTVDVTETSDKARVAHLIYRWYRSHARRVFEERLMLCYPRVEPFGVIYPTLRMRSMKLRWGSCSAAGRISLNLKLIQVPKSLIDYVILHELCHLKEHHHSADFYALLDRVLPDWHARREQLNQIEIAG